MSVWCAVRLFGPQMLCGAVAAATTCSTCGASNAGLDPRTQWLQGQTGMDGGAPPARISLSSSPTSTGASVVKFVIQRFAEWKSHTAAGTCVRNPVGRIVNIHVTYCVIQAHVQIVRHLSPSLVTVANPNGLQCVVSQR